MKIHIYLIPVLALAMNSQAAIIYTQNFNGLGSATSASQGWVTQQAVPWNSGDVGGVEPNSAGGAGNETLYFHVEGITNAIAYRDLGVGVTGSPQRFTLQLDQITREGISYAGSAYAELWGGNPTAMGSTLLYTLPLTLPTVTGLAGSQTSTGSVTVDPFAGNVFLRLVAPNPNAPSNTYTQANFDNFSVDVSPVPEPASGMLGLGALLVFLRRRR
jgi:MYXO-CTERM domain-containing protein